MRLRLDVNGAQHKVDADADEMLLAALNRLGLASVRETCAIGVCGACTVLLDGEPVSACLLLAAHAEGHAVTTVEGLGGEHRVQRAFAAAHAAQCGWCTPGMVLTAVALLAENPDPTDGEIRLAMAGNLCRCGSYVKIVDAIRRASGDG